MSKLSVEQKSIYLLLSKRRADFIIPDYQRPYAWSDDQCQTLWDDVFAFSIPDDDALKFNVNDDYFLGSIVINNEDGKLEVIDGQQRLTTIMLLLRAFYDKFDKMMDENSKSTQKKIAECLWQTNEFGEPDFDLLKIKSEVATDNDKEEFLEILKTGVVKKEQKSNYANNYKFFQEKIDDFLTKYPTYFPYLPTRIMGNCILLPIEAESQETALRIFSTLNDRGLPLSDADIFKAQFYKYYNGKGLKDKFIERWKELETICRDIFHPISGTAMDELFTRYMYFIRAKQGNKSSTTEALRKFYEKDNYSLLKKDETLSNLEILTGFWKDVAEKNKTRFSEEVLKKLFVLKYAPNGMWTYFVSVYFLQKRDANDELKDDEFIEFLTKTIAFIWAYAITNPGVNALRAPIYAEMVEIVNDQKIFAKSKIDAKIKTMLENYSFNNNRPITKSMLAWWAYMDPSQPLLDANEGFHTEHIYARSRPPSIEGIEQIGNKILLEWRINIGASDYRFEDKRKYYIGYTDNSGRRKEGSKISEFKTLVKQSDFTEKDIADRSGKILDAFVRFLQDNELLN